MEYFLFLVADEVRLNRTKYSTFKLFIALEAQEILLLVFLNDSKVVLASDRHAHLTEVNMMCSKKTISVHFRILPVV